MRRSIGSIRQLGEDHYKVCITIGTDSDTGNQKRKYKTVRGSKRQAEVVLQTMIAQYSDALQSDITISEYVNTVFIPRLHDELNKGNYKQRTVESYEDRLRLHVLPQIGHITFSALKTSHVRKCQDSGATEAMRKEIRKTLSILFKEAAYDDLIAYNPVLSVRPPKPSEYEPMVLDVEDIEVYLWHFKDTRAEPIILLAIGGAYRRGEIAALNVEDIDLDTGWVTIDDTYVETKNGIKHETRKNRKAHRNKLPSFIVERLREILPESGAVIQTLTGERMQPTSIRHLYERIRDKLPEGVPRITLKNLRHTSLSAAFDATGNVDRVANHGGHTKQVSKKNYIRQHDDQEETLSDDMDNFFRSALKLPKSDR